MAGKKDQEASILTFMGPPGSGKTSHTNSFAQRWGTSPVRGKAILPDLTKQHEAQRTLIPDVLFLPKLRQRLAAIEEDRVVLDNIPRTVAQAEVVMEWVARLGKPLHAVVLKIPLSESLDRSAIRLACSVSVCAEPYHPVLKPELVKGRCDKHPDAVLLRRVGDQPEAVISAYQRFENLIALIIPVLERGPAVIHRLDAHGLIKDVELKIIRELGLACQASEELVKS